MFFSVKELYNHAKEDRWAASNITDHNLTMNACRKYVKLCKEAIVRRDANAYISENVYCVYVGKWLRPWDIVPALRNWQAPEGDYGIGVEVEMGFRSLAASRTIADKIKNWKHIAVDTEGGDYPIEATFPPFLYSKMNSKRQPFRYLKLLRDNIGLVQRHAPGAVIGTHINVSKGGVNSYNYNRIEDMNCVLETLVGARWDNTPPQRALATKYFGRNPYGFANCNSGKYLEYKLFNSTTDGKALRRYINIAVSLTELITSTREINEESVIAALEAGYTKKN